MRLFLLLQKYLVLICIISKYACLACPGKLFAPHHLIMCNLKSSYWVKGVTRQQESVTYYLVYIVQAHSGLNSWFQFQSSKLQNKGEGWARMGLLYLLVIMIKNKMYYCLVFASFSLVLSQISMLCFTHHHSILWWFLLVNRIRLKPKLLLQQYTSNPNKNPN